MAPRTTILIAIAASTLAGCGGGEETGAIVNAPAIADNGTVIADAPEIRPEASADDAAVEVVDVPFTPHDAAPADAAPVAEARAIEEAIEQGTGVQRVRFGNGWGWMRQGQIVRTADRDGRSVEYFRPGDKRPFFVQRPGLAYAYDGDRPVREYDGRGRPRTLDNSRLDYARQAHRQGGERRERAEQIRDDTPRPEGGRWGEGGREPGDAGRPATPQRPERPERPKGPERSEERERPDRTQRPERGDRPERTAPREGRGEDESAPRQRLPRVEPEPQTQPPARPGG